jgi:hypothetical protein
MKRIICNICGDEIKAGKHIELVVNEMRLSVIYPQIIIHLCLVCALRYLPNEVLNCLSAEIPDYNFKIRQKNAKI